MANQKKILIVDDCEDHRIILRFQLRKIGQFDILEVSDGQQALDVVAHELFDLIFLNMGLPVLNGWEVARRIRAMPSPACDGPIIAFTAYVTSSQEQKALDAGCDDYIAKPVVDLTLLQQKVDRLLTKKRTP
jgi:two-component system cell cycle response regulator DivK